MPPSKTRNTSDPIRVMIVDDHPTLREGLRHRISAQHDMQVCGEAADAEDALRDFTNFDPDVTIVDLALRNSNGLDLIKALKTRHGQIRLLVHSMFDEAVYADRCLHAGAMGYINKDADPDEVIKAIRQVHSGRVYLSPAMASEVLSRSVTGATPQLDPVETLTDRQLEVFRLIGEGKTAQQIAAFLHISVHTVESHRENIKQKLNTPTLPDLIRRAVLWIAEKR